jgi:cytochrome bd ubiquinol oxidase subunit II
VTLELFWFCLIAVLWGGYFVLEGFDFGVGMLLPVVGRREEDRDVMLESIEPVWDGNEVWLVVAAGATFAAFPVWYATMFSGFYLALLLILVCLIVRAVSFEWRKRSDSASWRRRWLTLTVVASFGAPFFWGIALANLLDGVPLDSNGDYTGNLTDLFSVYTVFTGLVVVALFAFHGATFLTLRTTGELRERVSRAARTLAIPAAAAVIGFAVWTVALAVDRNDKSVFPPVVPAVLAGGALLLALVLVRSRRSGWAFAATAFGAVATVATLFTSLYPRVIVSSPNFDNSLTVSNAASSHYALVTITVVALVLTPIVLLYQGWTYYVFRARLGGAAPTEAGTAADDAPPDTAPSPGTPPA